MAVTNDLVFATATELATAIRQRNVSATEVLDAHLAQIARHNPALNAIVTLDEERARTRAREADDALAHSEVWGPLHGVPITIKDAIATAGLRTTSGFPSWADYVPPEDAPVVARLRAAGAIVVGKTNLSMLSGDGQTDNPIFGRSNNPWDLSRTPGGSGGGGSAALAAGLTPIDIGGDILDQCGFQPISVACLPSNRLNSECLAQVITPARSRAYRGQCGNTWA